MDTFTLKIHVTGLGLFAPDASPLPGMEPAMHLLLPHVPGHRGKPKPPGLHPHEEHVARMYFDSRNAPDHTGDPWIRIDGFGWTAPAKSSPHLDSALPAEVIDITSKASAGAKLPYAQLKRGKQFEVSSHLVFRDGAVADCLVPRARFTIGGGAPEWLTNHLIWEIPGLPSRPFQLNPVPLPGRTATPVEPITLVPNGPEMLLHLLNVPLREHASGGGVVPAEPRCDDTPNHFSAYDRLFRAGATRPARCVADSYERRCCPPAPFGVERAKVIYTCMLATANLDYEDC